MSFYEGMLPKERKEGKRGYYPVTNKQEWDDLPDLYKAMEWPAVPDPYTKNKMLRAVKSVTFDVVYMEPYGVSARVSVHPEAVQAILFCHHEKTQCQLYSICEVELEGGTRLSAEWLQDSVTGAFAIRANHDYVAIQGGFNAHVPECIERLEDGTFKWKGLLHQGLNNHFELMNPFRKEKVVKKDSVEKFMDALAEYGLEHGWTDRDIIDTLVDCGVTQEDFIKYEKEDFVKEYFEKEEAFIENSICALQESELDGAAECVREYLEKESSSIDEMIAKADTARNKDNSSADAKGRTETSSKGAMNMEMGK